MTEGEFLTALVERTGVRLLIDVADLHTNHVNRGEDPATALDALRSRPSPTSMSRAAWSGTVCGTTASHPVTRPVLNVLAGLCARITPPGVLLERDEDFPEGGSSPVNSTRYALC